MTPPWKIAVVTDRRGSGYGGAHYTGQLLDALRGDGFADVVVIGPADYPRTTIPLRIDLSARAKIGKWLSGRTEADIDEFRVDALHASRAHRPFDAVVLDGSLLGGALPMLRRLLPGTPVITLFHNVELDFVDSRPRLRNPHLVVKRSAVMHAEGLAASADVRIALHRHDAERIDAVYGQPADHLFPITVSPVDGLPLTSGRGDYALFVGSLFKPNIDAVQWLYRYVAPRSPLPVVVAGKGMEALRERCPDSDSFRIVGAVDDLRPWYARAAIVVSPVTNGGGMKVKNVEALAHGKPVLAASHSAIGLDAAIEAGHVRIANTPDEWVAALAQSTTLQQGADPAIAAWCAHHFGRDARARQLRAFLDGRLRQRPATVATRHN